MSRDAFINRDRRHGHVAYRRSKHQEKELAARLRGVRVPGSGSGSQKGDIKKAYNVLRIEAKTTSKKSFSITKEMVEKIENAALTNRELPAIVIEFLDSTGAPESEVAVVPMYVLTVLGEQYEKS